MSEGLRLYNTLTRSKEPFEPIDPDNVRMYVCGPTVYDYAHIGNARPAIVFDVLFRLLRHLYGADHVTYVRNITDVDDKINARALRDFGADIEAGRLTLNEAIRKVTETTYDQYQKDVAALGCLPPTVQPRATEFVLPRADGRSDMVSLIQSLIDRGHAYVARGTSGAEVLFDTASMPDYGRLSKRNLDEQQAGARVAVEAHKKNPADFVLWKESSADEPGWNAHFHLRDGGHARIHGRPGWHIECSAMSAAYLGEVFDIHGGGLDLIFPHHENEIAQSRCAHGTDVMANVWMHNGFLQVEGRKMSKSEGNFVTIRQNLRGSFPGWQGGPWHGLVLRCAMLMTHYRQPIDWTLDRLLEARSKIWKWNLFISNWRNENWAQFQRFGFGTVSAIPFPEVVDAIADDLNTPLAINFLIEVLERPDFEKDVERLISSLLMLGLLNDRSLAATAVMTSEVSRAGGNNDTFSLATELGIARANDDTELVEELAEKLRREGWTYGWLSPDHIDLKRADASTKLDVDDLITRRLALIAQKNWAEADRIRDELLAQGIQLKDGKDPATGERVTTWEVKR